MGDPKTVTRPFSSKGLVLKQDPALLSPDTYAELTNAVSPIEGNLSVRPGNQRLTNHGALPGSLGTIHTITHLHTGGITSPNAETIYIGQGTNILAAQGPLPAVGAGLTFTTVASGVADPGPYSTQRFGSDDYAAGKNGTPFKFFGCPRAMLKSSGGTSMLGWGIRPPHEPPGVGNSSTGTGPAAFTGAEAPYLYVYTYLCQATLAESNPCVFTVIPGVTPNGHQIRMTLAGTPDPQVNTINVYRSGGVYADGFYRLVGNIPNPGAGGVFFNDGATDTQIANAPLLALDNDPPIPSTLLVPFQAQVTGFNSPGGLWTSPGFSTLYLNVYSGSLFPLTIGSNMSIIDGATGNTEICILADLNIVLGIIVVYLQHPYGIGSFIGATVAAASPATIVLSAFESMFVAGDKNNPHVLYKSKTGQPESFGVFNFEAGIADAINVGNPSDAIVALVEYGGGVLSMNTKSLYFVAVSQGAMGIPTRSPALRGLYSKNAWCKISNQIWYLAFDGIYSYAGGEEVWQSEAIDPLFRGIAVGNYSPIDMRQGLGTIGSDVIAMAANGVEVLVSYLDIFGTPARLRYHTLLKRWSIEIIGDAAYTVVPTRPELISAQYAEGDSGRFYIAKQDPTGQCGLFLDNTGDTDGWVNAATDGAPIVLAVTPNSIASPPSMDRLWSDFILELSNPLDTLSFSSFYNFSPTPDPLDTALIGPGSRRKYEFPFKASSGQAAYALTQRFLGTVRGPVSLYSLTVNYWELAQQRQGLAFDWDDCGWPNAKTFQALNIEIDTGGIPASIQLQSDGGSVFAPLPILTTSLNRNRILTLPEQFQARNVRMVITPGPGGYTNYYKHVWEFVKEPPDLTFYDSYPPDDCGYPDAKTFQYLNLESDTGGLPATLQLISEGVTLPTTFSVLTNYYDRNRIITLPDLYTARDIRMILTAAPGHTLRHYQHHFEFVKEPADLSFYDSYPWDDCGWPNEKTFRVLNLEVDTGGVSAQLQLLLDGANFGAVIPVLTTQSNRNVILTLPDNMVGRHVRFILTPTGGTTVRHYKHAWEYFKEPPYVVFFDSFPITFSNAFTFVKQAWLQYQSGVPITVSFYSGSGGLLYTITLPAHPAPSRQTERFYLPASSTVTTNKSKTRRFTVASSDGVTTFKIWLDGSRLEYMEFGAQQRQNYQQVPLSQFIGPQIGA